MISACLPLSIPYTLYLFRDPTSPSGLSLTNHTNSPPRNAPRQDTRTTRADPHAHAGSGHNTSHRVMMSPHSGRPRGFRRFRLPVARRVPACTARQPAPDRHTCTAGVRADVGGRRRVSLVSDGIPRCLSLSSSSHTRSDHFNCCARCAGRAAVAFYALRSGCAGHWRVARRCPAAWPVGRPRRRTVRLRHVTKTSPSAAAKPVRP